MLRLQAAKEKRKNVISSVPPFATREEEEGLSAAEWVKRSRRVEMTRAATTKGEDKDDEDKDKDKDKKKNDNNPSYSSDDLTGMRVMHDAGELEEGRDVILTLADANILDKDEHGVALGVNEEGDVLENVNMVDEEKRLAAEKRKKRSKQPVYVVCYSIVLLSFLVCDTLFLSYPSIASCLPSMPRHDV
jgi:U4/U6.U5 tri-snRNP-associated protein 1